MKAVLCTRYCAPEELELRELPDPVAGQGQAVVRVRSAALNFFDTLIIAGKYQHKPPFPFSPGAEFAGLIESVGNGAGDLAPGERCPEAEQRHGEEHLAVRAEHRARVVGRGQCQRARGDLQRAATHIQKVRCSRLKLQSSPGFMKAGPNVGELATFPAH